MSMMCWLAGVTPAQIAALRAKPTLANDLTVALTAEPMARLGSRLSRMPPEQRKQLEERLAAMAAHPAMKEAQAATEPARARIAAIGPLEKALCLEKSWHMLHYLLTGHADPANAPGDLLMTGEPIGNDGSYGPPRLHPPGVTREFSEFLQSQDLARVQARINVEAMERARIYSVRVGRGSKTQVEEELRGEVGVYFPLLRDYVQAMSAKANGLLIWVS
jgi:hypothetical protein